MSGIMKPDYSDPHIASMSNLLMSNFIGGVDSHVIAVGTSNTTDIPLYNEALKGLPLRTILKGRAINLVEAIEGMRAYFQKIETSFLQISSAWPLSSCA